MFFIKKEVLVRESHYNADLDRCKAAGVSYDEKLCEKLNADEVIVRVVDDNTGSNRGTYRATK